MKDPVQTDHQWPTEPGEHLYGQWFPYSSNQQYRKCVHPQCGAIEIRKVVG